MEYKKPIKFKDLKPSKRIKWRYNRLYLRINNYLKNTPLPARETFSQLTKHSVL